MKDDTFIEKLRDIFVSLERYELEVPQLKQIMFAAIGMVVVGFWGAVIAFFIRK